MGGKGRHHDGTSFRAAVFVVVNKGKDGRNAVLWRLLQAPEKPLSTAEYPCSGKRTQYAEYLSSGKRTQILLSIPVQGNELNRLRQEPEMLMSTAE